VKPSKLWQSLLVMVFWAPVPLMAALPGLTPDWLKGMLFGLPVSGWLVTVLTAILIYLSWRFSADQDAQGADEL
jgi:hypothetical protein